MLALYILVLRGDILMQSYCGDMHYVERVVNKGVFKYCNYLLLIDLFISCLVFYYTSSRRFPKG